MSKEVIITFKNCSEQKVKNLMLTNDISKAISYMLEEKITYLEFAEPDGEIIFTVTIKENSYE